LKSSSIPLQFFKRPKPSTVDADFASAGGTARFFLKAFELLSGVALSTADTDFAKAGKMPALPGIALKNWSSFGWL
jgi:hypothetical protein